MKKVLCAAALVAASTSVSAAPITFNFAQAAGYEWVIEPIHFEQSPTHATVTFLQAPYHGSEIMFFFTANETGRLSFDAYLGALGTWDLTAGTYDHYWTNDVIGTWNDPTTVGRLVGAELDIYAGTKYVLSMVPHNHGSFENIYELFAASINNIELQVSEVPLPAAFWLFGSVLAGGIAARRKHK